MSRDFFLNNRAYQLNRLCSTNGTPGIASGFVVPAEKMRTKLPSLLRQLYELVERIVEQTADRQAASDLEHVELQSARRRDLEEFERLVVSCRFSVDPTVKQPAVALIRAIFADAEYFSGLKPLPQYTEAFAYELLFPSWLNLLKATMLPRSSDGKPRLEGQMQGELFRFLADLEKVPPNSELALVGFATFIASRFDAPECEHLLQRLVDQYDVGGQCLLDRLDSLDTCCKDARELTRRIHDFLTVKTCLMAAGNIRYQIAYKRPPRRALPTPLVENLNHLESNEQWTDYFAIAKPLSQMIDSEHGLSAEYSQLFNREVQHSAALVQLLVLPEVNGQVSLLSPDVQVCLADLISKQPSCLTSDLPTTETFASQIGSRLNGASEEVCQFFSQLLIADDGNRSTLLSACRSPDLRQRLSEQLLARAAAADDSIRFIYLAQCAAAISPKQHAGEALPALHALEAVVANRSIGNKELSDLLDDLKANATVLFEMLASPMMATVGKSPRLASLLLTLNEISEKLATTGAVDNFSVVRAKYAKLTNLELD